MNRQNENIENLFRSKLKDFEADVSGSVWDNISAQLAADDAKKSAIQRRKRIVLSVGVLAAAVLFGVLWIIPLNHPQDVGIVQTSHPDNLSGSKSVLPNQESAKTKSVTGLNNNSISSFFKTKKNTILIAKNRNTNAEHTERSSPEQKTNSLEFVPDKTANHPEKSSESKPRKLPVSKEELERKTQEFRNASQRQTDKLFADADQKTNKYKTNKNTREGRMLGLALAGGIGLSSQSQESSRLLVLSNDLRSSEAKNIAVSSFSSSSGSSYELDHAWPVSVYFTILKPLTKSIDLEFGLSYSYLSSKQKGTSSSSIRQSQQFNYLGIPVGLNFEVLRWSNLRVGFLMGGSIQKDISGRLKENIQSSSSSSSSSTNIHQNKIQPSVNANIHLSYPLGGDLCVFGKIGGAYYFDMNNKYRTIYSDKKLLPDIGIGISLRLNK